MFKVFRLRYLDDVILGMLLTKLPFKKPAD